MSVKLLINYIDRRCDNICSDLNPKPITVVMNGTHCSGKKTSGEKLAKLLNREFQGELGDVLRDFDNLKAGGHHVGDGSNVNREDWDTRIYSAECQRGQSSSRDIKLGRREDCLASMQ